MTPETVLEDKAPILLVDDQPLNLDALEAVLESPDHELIRAQSAEQAMLALLQRDVAAIVLDIRMPGVSGLELAALIKKRKRTRHIPILFLTAHLLDEKDILRGYGAGAVDYLSKPFNPDILRSKIAVFVDLFRKTRALGAANARLQDEVAERQRAQEALRAANDALEGRVRERTIDLSLANQALRESEQRIRLLLDSVGEGIVGLDARGRATFANPAAAAQLGYRAEELIGVPVDDLLAVVGGESAAAPDDAATAGLGAARVSALRRKNGTTFPVEVMRTPVRSEEGEVTGEVVVFRDLTVRLRWQRRLAAEHAVTRILAGAPGLPDAAPRILARLCETLEARTAELWVPGENGGPLSRAAAYPEAAARESWARGEARDAAAALPARAFAGGEPAWLTDLAGAGDHPVGARSVWAFPILDHGVCEGVVCLYSAEPAGPDDMLLAMMGAVGREIGAFVRRTRAEAELRAHRERLEELVRERTRALERSHERLRQAERLATVGTLAAGLGHDLSNLILPIRARLHSLAESRLSVAAAADVAAIGEAAGYLQRLASGLRLLAVDPERAAEREGHTDLAAWWRDVAGVFRAALPRGVRLEGSCPAGLPPVAVTASRLTQAVFNLVQNSAEALAGAGGQRGTVTIDASLARPEDDGEEAQRPAPRPPAVILRIADDGPGMAPTVAARCFEPYFSTKVRSVSTGMGLALVRGWVEAVGGSIHLRTNPGQGTEFTLRFPVAVGVPAAAPSARTPAPLRAAITVDDRRTVGFLGAMIEAASARAAAWEGDGVPDAELWVVGGAAARPERIAAFLAQDPARRVVALAESHGQPPPPDADAGAAPRVCYLGRRPTTSALRRSLMAALEKPEEGPPPPPHPAPAASMA